MSTQIFVNLPVKDLPRSIDFFTRLGYRFDPQFTNESGTCMIIDENIFVMLLTEPFFQGFTPKPVSDAMQSTEVLICLSCESRDHVNDLVSKAIQAGGTTPNPSKDYGFMYQHGYQDLDGHLWELVYMEGTPGDATAETH